ncbi:MAG: hypothetical protein N3B01_05375 [Verrucomicrobiae bacterium]|nr:hypothetical protein [Verrucomicrobiae bacterium]
MRRADLKAGLVCGLGVLAVATAALMWQHAVQRWLESDLRESKAYDTVQWIKELETQLALTETEHREYVLTALQKSLRVLPQLAGELGQRSQWRKLQELLSQRLAQLEGKSALDPVVSQQLRNLVREISREELSRLREHIEHKQAQMLNTVKVVVVILVGGTLFFLWMYWLLRREIVARTAAELEIRKEHQALEKVLRDLEQSHWHLDKVAEFLPICMECGKVRTAETRWETIIEYFRKNNLLFSHGLCPECAARIRHEFSEKRSSGSTPTAA